MTETATYQYALAYSADPAVLEEYLSRAGDEAFVRKQDYNRVFQAIASQSPQFLFGLQRILHCTCQSIWVELRVETAVYGIFAPNQ